jgi:hypothetical protein
MPPEASARTPIAVAAIGDLIAAAVETTIPQPYRLVVQEALHLMCDRRGADRRALLVGLGAITAIVVIALITAK